MISIAPTIAIGTSNESISKVMNSVVIVVPIFVPRIIPIDCLKVMTLAEIKPIVITITAELLCKIPVTRVPTNNPLNGVLVNLISQRSRDWAEALNRPVLNRVIPKINNNIKRINMSK